MIFSKKTYGSLTDSVVHTVLPILFDPSVPSPMNKLHYNVEDMFEACKEAIEKGNNRIGITTHDNFYSFVGHVTGVTKVDKKPYIEFNCEIDNQKINAIKLPTYAIDPRVLFNTREILAELKRTGEKVKLEDINIKDFNLNIHIYKENEGVDFEDLPHNTRVCKRCGGRVIPNYTVSDDIWGKVMRHTPYYHSELCLSCFDAIAQKKNIEYLPEHIHLETIKPFTEDEAYKKHEEELNKRYEESKKRSAELREEMKDAKIMMNRVVDDDEEECTDETSPEGEYDDTNTCSEPENYGQTCDDCDDEDCTDSDK